MTRPDRDASVGFRTFRVCRNGKKLCGHLRWPAPLPFGVLTYSVVLSRAHRRNDALTGVTYVLLFLMRVKKGGWLYARSVFRSSGSLTVMPSQMFYRDTKSICPEYPMKSVYLCVSLSHDRRPTVTYGRCLSKQDWLASTISKRRKHTTWMTSVLGLTPTFTVSRRCQPQSKREISGMLDPRNVFTVFSGKTLALCRTVACTSAKSF